MVLQRLGTSQALKGLWGATAVVVASDTSAAIRRTAMSMKASMGELVQICDGVDDHIEIQAALDALPATGGEVKLLEGSFVLGAQVTRAIDNFTIKGCGKATSLTLDGITAVISAGSQDNWLIANLATDAGGIDIRSATDSFVKNVWINNIPTDIEILTDAIKMVVAKNTSGGALAAGDVVILKAVAAGNEITTTVNQGDDNVYGMVAEVIADAAYGLVQVKGKTTVLKVNGTVDIAVGDILGTYTAAGISMKAGAGDQGFARALEAYAVADSAGVIDAYIKSPWD